MAKLIALKYLVINNAIWYRDGAGGTHAADILAVDTSMKSWGIVKVKVLRHVDQMPLWITRRQVIDVCD